MMKFIREHIFVKWFWVLMAIHIINISIDMPDTLPNYIPEDLKINEIESIAELVLEDGFGISNAIPESDDADDENNPSFEKKIDFYCVKFNVIEIIEPSLVLSYESQPIVFNLPISTSDYFKKIIKPPDFGFSPLV